MNYRKVYIAEFNLEVEVGVVPSNSTSRFLSSLEVGSTISKPNYEDFLLTSLIKDLPELMKPYMDDAQSERLLRQQLLAKIYTFNTKLDPKCVVIHNNRLMHQIDSLRSGGPSEPVLTANPGWISSIKGDIFVDPDSVGSLIEEIWEDAKKDVNREYFLSKVGVLDMEIPVLHLEANFDMSSLIVDFVLKRCQGDLRLAQQNNRFWMGYVIALCIPRIEEIIHALSKANYISSYTDQVIHTQLYLAVTRVNPELEWEHIDWSVLESATLSAPRDEIQSRVSQAVNRTPVAQSLRSSREEAEAEKPKFRDVSYEKILTLSEKIKTRIRGQDPSVDALCEAIAIARVGLRGDKRPIGAFLFTGKTGVGKTELAKVLADELTDRDPIRIDCSEYQQPHEISKIFGSPPGYAGYEDDSKNPHASTPPSTVARKLQENPFSVVLFDEIEKADPAINNVLLQIMDEGHVTTGRGDIVSFNNAVVILTSNIGTDEAEEVCKANKLGFGEDSEDKCALTEETINAAIKTRFKPEFRNRLSEIIIFNSLSREVCREIVDVLLNKTKYNLEKAQHISISWDDSVRDAVLKDGYSEDYGARELERSIQKLIELPLAKYILNSSYISTDSVTDELEEGSSIQLRFIDDKLEFKIQRDKNNGKKNNNKGRRLQYKKSTSSRQSRTYVDQS